MACLTCIAVYFLGRDLGGRGVGIFTAFFMAISAAFISRTSLGFFDTENIGIFGMASTSLFFLRSIELENPPKRRLAYAIAAGLSLGYLHASWGASRYVAGLLTMFVFVSILKGLFERRYLVSFTITMGIGYLLALLVPKLGFEFLLSIENIAILGFMLFLFIYHAIRGRVQTGKLMLIVGLMLIILVGGVFALESFGLIGSISNKFISVLDPSRRSQNALLESVAEHRRSVWVNFFVDFGLTMGLSVFGSYLALRRLDYKRLFGILFFLSSLYFAGSMIRLTLILSIPVSLMAAFGLNGLVKPFVSVVSRGTQRRSKRRTGFFGVSREMGVIFTVFILIATLPTVWSAAGSANRPGSLVSSGGVGTHDWLQALSWMKDNLPEDAIVVSWWDYGYWIETLSNKTTLADGATRNTTQIARIARIMLNNHSESLRILEEYDATHILVFQTFDPSNPENKYGLGEWGKWLPMARIGGFNETEYYDFRTGTGFTDKFKLTTLARLMNMQADPDHFKIAFASVNLFVLVYEIIY
jgi:dolichyl-diphosphooligosaccharide--protein glycosyltransferase